MPEVGVMMDPEVGDCEPVQLKPFIHQVGGHTSMLRFNDTTLCKPLISREYRFYHNIPSDLKTFIPEFRGIIEVELQEDSEGYITLIGYPPPSCQDKGGNSSPVSSGSDTDTASPVLQAKKDNHKAVDPYSARLLRSGSIEVSPQTKKVFHMDDPKSGKQSKTEGINPWSLKCHKRQLSKMRTTKKGSDSYTSKFILLENVAAHCYNPCILDLKMGTRQHGDDVSEAKKQSHTRKCESSTSCIIGVRICGMQVYQADTGKYICKNKYYGRDLSVDGFNDALRQFLHNGQQFRIELIPEIIQHLEELSRRIRQQDTYRFYSSSLLIMYDGLIIGEDDSEESREHMEEHDDSDSNTSSVSGGDKSSSPYLHQWSQGRPKVDVRMIDFAHSTRSGFYEDKTVHSGPDTGYLFGLENLIKLFKEILKNSEEEQIS